MGSRDSWENPLRSSKRLLTGIAVVGLLAGAGIAFVVAQSAPESDALASADSAGVGAPALPGLSAVEGKYATSCLSTLKASVSDPETLTSKLASVDAISVDGSAVASVLVKWGAYRAWCTGWGESQSYVMVESPRYTFDQPASKSVVVGPSVVEEFAGGTAYYLGRAGGDVLAVELSDGERPTLRVEPVAGGWWIASEPSGGKDNRENLSVTSVTSGGRDTVSVGDAEARD